VFSKDSSRRETIHRNADRAAPHRAHVARAEIEIEPRLWQRRELVERRCDLSHDRVPCGIGVSFWWSSSGEPIEGENRAQGEGSEADLASGTLTIGLP